MNKPTKLVYCSYEDCGLRRRHWCIPYTPRGQQTIRIPKTHKGPYYCSFECACMAGAMCMDTSKKPRYDWKDLPDAKEVSIWYYFKSFVNRLIYNIKRGCKCD